MHDVNCKRGGGDCDLNVFQRVDHNSRQKKEIQNDPLKCCGNQPYQLYRCHVQSFFSLFFFFFTKILCPLIRFPQQVFKMYSILLQVRTLALLIHRKLK